MKTIRFSSLALLMGGLMMAAVFTGCGNKKKAVNEGEVSLILPCSGDDYFSDKKMFRANASGESLDQMTAKKKAMSNARAQLSADINTIMKVVSDNYVKSSEVNNDEEVLERFEENARSVINQELRGVKQICEELVRVKATGKYKYYVAIELAGDDIVEAYNNRLSDDDQLKVDYNYERFKKTFEEEMEKYRNGQ